MVQILDAVDGNKFIPFNFMDGVSGLDFSPDGKRLATSSWDGTAKVWDVETGQELLSLVGHDGAVNDIVFSLDGKLIATAGEIPG